MLECLPCLDSEARAEARRRELQLSPIRAIQLARATTQALTDGRYATETGVVVEWSDWIDQAIQSRTSIPPHAELPGSAGPRFERTTVQVANETTLGSARRLGGRPLALNFANGLVPGGGFLLGALAQEEALCRSSGLYATIQDDPMYAAHRRDLLHDSSAWAILSPQVPVYRDDDGEPLEQPWKLDFLTCAAPIAYRHGQPRAGDLLQERIHRILAIARAYQYETLVLGAWGCGAFGNDPIRTARDFRKALEGPFAGAFAQAIFAIADWSPNRKFLGPFRDAFPPTHAPINGPG